MNKSTKTDDNLQDIQENSNSNFEFQSKKHRSEVKHFIIKKFI